LITRKSGILPDLILRGINVVIFQGCRLDKRQPSATRWERVSTTVMALNGRNNTTHQKLRRLSLYGLMKREAILEAVEVSGMPQSFFPTGTKVQSDEPETVYGFFSAGMNSSTAR
jgi:hypothetical protein